MPQKYVIFSRHVFAKRDYVRFNCEAMSKRGYEVLIVQCGVALEGMDLESISRGEFQSLSEALAPQNKEELSAILDNLSARDLILSLPGL